ncbi:MAG: transglycosylase domain-containing protein [Bacilli bacterium]|nr:transglycosylase domain-containing protein [Bacilli bacterium]
MKKFLKNQDNMVILIVSLVAFIAGCLAKHALLSFLIVALADIFFFYPEISKLLKKDRNKTIAKEVMHAKEKVKKAKKKKKLGKIILLVILFMIIAVIGLMVAFASYIVINAPKFNPDELYASEPSVLYDVNGDEITRLGSEKRENITYDELPEVLIDAIVATEDSKFFQHHGFDLSRFLVASFKQVLTGGGGGASTLTMQVVKNTFTSTEASGFDGIKRKFTDIYMAVFQVEKKYTKKEILEFYVNSYYLGNGAYGVEQASHNYFGKSAKDLSLNEAALIAGLFQAPNAYDPYQHPDKAEQRRNQVLSLMKRHGYITDEEYKIAVSTKVEDMLTKSSEDGIKSAGTSEWQPFIDLVVEDVVEKTEMDPYKVSMKIYTTLDKEKQSVINDILSGKTYNWQNDYADTGIIVEDIKTGAIVAVGNGRNKIGERQYNNATMINKQIGSTAKPLYDYAPGIEYENWSTYKLFDDEPYSYSDGTTILNWDRKYEGKMTLRTAMAHSRNIPALKAFQENKNSNILKFVQSLGLHPEVSNGIVHEAHSIGGYTGENPRVMAAAYAAFGNGGFYIEPHSYTKIIINDTNEVIEPEWKKTRVMSEETAYMMTSLLQSSAQYGLGNQYNIGGAQYGAKTGTSNYDSNTIKRWGFGPDAVNDLWVNGVSPDYAISVWYGYLNRTEENKKYTSTSYTIAHRNIFNLVARNVFKKDSKWEKPEDVIEVEVEMGSWPAALASENTPESRRVKELFKAGTEPTEVSSKYAQLPDVTNLKGTVNGDKLTLTWNGVNVSKNDESVGDIIYKVYSNDNNNLVHIADVSTNTIDITIDQNSAATYVVKTSYSNYSNNQSNGTTVTIQSLKKETINVSLINQVSEVKIGSTITPSSKDIKVVSNQTDVTANSDVKIKITSADGKEVTTIDTTKEGSYTITYNVTYKNATETISKTIKITK